MPNGHRLIPVTAQATPPCWSMSDATPFTPPPPPADQSAAAFSLRTLLLVAFAIANSALFFAIEQPGLHQRPIGITYMRFGRAKERVQLRMKQGVQPGPVKCPNGKYRPPDAGPTLGECRFCPRGVYGDSPGLTSSDCTAKCPKGTYQDLPGARSIMDCKPCPAGVYGSAPGLTTSSCTAPCPLGKYSVKTGLQSQSECDDCPPNYRGPNGRRGNNQGGREGGYPCDRYIEVNTILNGREAAMDARRAAFMASTRHPKNQRVDNSGGPE